MSKAKVQFHEFNPTIYPRKLWVVKGKNCLPNIQEMFSEVDGDEICFSNDLCLGFKAIVLSVQRKSDGKCGVLVWLREEYNLSDIAHESCHVAMEIAKEVGIVADYDNQEPIAYLVGFAFDCIKQVYTNKFNVNLL
jgi:hypothetical protein